MVSHPEGETDPKFFPCSDANTTANFCYPDQKGRVSSSMSKQSLDSLLSGAMVIRSRVEINAHTLFPICKTIFLFLAMELMMEKYCVCVEHSFYFEIVMAGGSV